MQNLLFVVLLALPAACSAAYIVTSRRIGVVTSAKYFSLFAVCCSALFYLAFAVSNVLIVRINMWLFGVQMHVLDGYGYVVEILGTMSVTVVMYLLLSGFFRVSYRSSLLKYPISIVFYMMNHALVSLFFMWTDRFFPF
jgi:hypothetical protein